MSIIDKFGIIIFLSVIFGLYWYVLPNMQTSASENFNKTLSAMEKNNDIIFKSTNMTEIDIISYTHNSCEIVFRNAYYRQGDAELCKSKLISQFNDHKDNDRR